VIELIVFWVAVSALYIIVIIVALGAILLPLAAFVAGLMLINSLFDFPRHNLDELTTEELEVLSGWEAYGC